MAFDTVEYLMKQKEKVGQQFSYHKGYWDQIDRFVNVSGGSPLGQFSGKNVSNYDTQRFIFENTPQHSLDLLSSFMFFMLFNPTKNWLKWKYGVPEIDEDRDVRLYLERKSLVANALLNKSNFYSHIYPWLKTLLAKGNASLLMRKNTDKKKGIQKRLVFKNLPLTCTHFGESQVTFGPNKVFRKMRLTFTEMAMLFGEEAVKGALSPDEERDWGKAEFMDKERDVSHIIYPKEELSLLKDTISTVGKDYISFYILDKTKKVLEKGGFAELPIICARLELPEQGYVGVGIGKKVLNDSITLQFMNRLVIRSAQKGVDPLTLLENDSVIGTYRYRPGSAMIVRPGFIDSIKQLEHKGNIAVGHIEVDAARERIARMFYVDKIQIPRDKKQMTATEIVQYVHETSTVLAPIVSQITVEFLLPFANLLSSFMEDMNVMPELPDEVLRKFEGLEGAGTEPTFNSPMADAQMAMGLNSLNQFLNVLLAMAKITPRVLDVLDDDAMIREIARLTNVRVDVVKAAPQVQALRQARAQQEQEAQEQAQRLQESEIAKNYQGVGPEGAAANIGPEQV